MGVSRAQGYRLIKLDIDESGVDRQELLSWSIQTQMAAAGQAIQQKNPGAVVSAMRQLDHMTGTGTTPIAEMEIDNGLLPIYRQRLEGGSPIDV